MTMRDPRHPLWPEGGERTELLDVAERWKWEYVDWCQDKARARQLGRTEPKRLGKAAEEYLRHREGIVSPQTLVNDRVALRHLRKDWPDDTSVALVDPQRTLDRMLRAGKWRPSTIKSVSRFLSSFFRSLGLPYAVKVPKEQARRAKAWTDAEVEKIRDEAGDLLLPLDCGLFMGLRLREIWGLRWEDVGKNTVRVQRQYPDAALKSKRERTAVILPGWKHRRKEGPVVTLPFEDYRRLSEVLTAVGLKGERISWHAARHTYARRFLEKAPDLRLLQASLGHRSVVTTEGLYDWLVPDKAAEMALGRMKKDRDVAPHGRKARRKP